MNNMFSEYRKKTSVDGQDHNFEKKYNFKISPSQ